MKTLVLIILIVLLILAFVPDTWLGKLAGVGGPKVAGTVLKVSGWVRGLKAQLTGLIKPSSRQPKLLDPFTGKPLPTPLPLTESRKGISARAAEPKGRAEVPGGDTVSGWADALKKVLPLVLPVLVGLVVIVVIRFIRSRRAGMGSYEPWAPGEEAGEVTEGTLPQSFSPLPSSVVPSSRSAATPFTPSYTPTAPSRSLSDLAKGWGWGLLAVWVFAVLCLVASELSVVPLVWQQTAGFFVSFALLGITPFVFLMFAGEALTSILAPLATGAQKIFGDAGRSTIVLLKHAAPLVALVGILLLLVTKVGGNVAGLATSTDISAVSKMGTVLTAVTAGDPFNVALVSLSLIGYVIVVMRKVF